MADIDLLLTLGECLNKVDSSPGDLGDNGDSKSAVMSIRRCAAAVNALSTSTASCIGAPKGAVTWRLNLSLQKRVAVVALTIATSLTGVALGAQPAAAADGGCQTDTKNGFNVGACSSDNGVTVYGDAYLNAMPSGATCNITIKIIDITEGYKAKAGRSDPCWIGHHSPLNVPKVSGHKYQTTAEIYYNLNHNVWISPTTT